MRFLLLFLLLSVSIAVAANQQPEIIRFVSFNLTATCPDNNLHILATASDGTPAPEVKLRLVLHEPYQGLRAVMVTDADGQASVELTKPGNYRIYVYSLDYNYDDFVEFDYPEMCPPPPPIRMEINVTPDCEKGTLGILVTSEGAPLSEAFVRAEKWSSLTGTSGSVSFPLEEGQIYITAEKSGYSKIELFQNINCSTPPVECVQDADCDAEEYCAENECVAVIQGTCGQVENHSWIEHECCSDADCPADFICENHVCTAVQLPEPQEPPVSEPEANLTNETNVSENLTEEKPEAPPESSSSIIYVGAGIVVCIVVFLIVAKLSGRKAVPK